MQATGAVGTTFLVAGAFTGSVAADNINVKNFACSVSTTTGDLDGDGDDDLGDLVLSIEATGLGSQAEIQGNVVGTVDACYACKNGGGNFPQDPKKELVEEDIDQTFVITADQSGRIEQDLVVDLVATSTLRCPGKQDPTLVYVDWNNVMLTLSTVTGDPPSPDEDLVTLSCDPAREVLVTNSRAQCEVPA